MKKKHDSTPPLASSPSSAHPASHLPPSPSLNGIGVPPSSGPRGPSTSRPPSPSPSLQSFHTQSSGNNNNISPRFSWAQSLTRGRASSLLQQHDAHGHTPLQIHTPIHTHSTSAGTEHAPTLSTAKTLIGSGAGTGPNTPTALTTQLDALHTLLTLAGINPALLTQIWSQVMYWAACKFLSTFFLPL